MGLSKIDYPQDPKSGAESSQLSQVQMKVFTCPWCLVEMSVPVDLPATTGSCIKCGNEVTSPSPAPGAPDEQLTKGDEKGSQQFYGILKKKLILGGLVTISIAAIIVGGLLWMESNYHSAASQKEARGGSSTFFWESEALAILKGFLEAETYEERQKYIQGAELFHDELEHGLLLEGLAASSFYALPLHERDRIRGIFGMAHEKPVGIALRENFLPILSFEHQVLAGSYLEGLPIHIRSSVSTHQFLDEEVTIAAYFKKTDDGLKLDWPVFAQSIFGLLESFALGDEAHAEEIFRVAIVKDVHLPLVDSESVLAVYRIFDASNPDQSYRVDVNDPKILKNLESRWKERGMEAEAITIRLEKKEDRLILTEILCWEFLGLGGAR